MSDDLNDQVRQMVEYIRQRYGEPGGYYPHENLPGMTRAAEAEAIVTALRRLETAMYNSDYEGSWPRDANELQSAYEAKYGVSLDPEDAS
jgi:hypothetical protein